MAEPDRGPYAARLMGLSWRLYRRRFWLIAGTLNFFALASLLFAKALNQALAPLASGWISELVEMTPALGVFLVGSLVLLRPIPTDPGGGSPRLVAVFWYLIHGFLFLALTGFATEFVNNIVLYHVFPPYWGDQKFIWGNVVFVHIVDLMDAVLVMAAYLSRVGLVFPIIAARAPVPIKPLRTSLAASRGHGLSIFIVLIGFTIPAAIPHAALWSAILSTTAQPMALIHAFFVILTIFLLLMAIPIAAAYLLWHEGRDTAAVFD